MTHVNQLLCFKVQLSTCLCILVLIGLCAYQPSAYSAEISVTLGEGKSRWYFRDRGELESRSIRIAYIHETEYKWDFFQSHTLKLELEGGAYHWEDPLLDDNKVGVFITPMWRYYAPFFSQKVYAGLGIGLSYTNDDELLDRKLGSRLLFEDRFEAGIILAERHRISFGVNHYSNANLANINHGVNYFFLSYGFKF